MKVVIYISSLSRGGAERVVSTLASFLKEKCDITVLTDTVHTSEYKEMDFKRVSLDYIVHDSRLKRAIHKVLYYKKLRKAVDEIKPDVVVSFSIECGLRMKTALLKTDYKQVISVRSNPEVDFDTPSKVEKIKQKLASIDGFVFQTKAQRDFFGEEIATRSVVILNPVAKEFLEQKPEATVEKQVISAGRLTGSKDQNVLLEAYDKAAESLPEYKFLLYGNGERKEALLAYRETLKHKEQIFLCEECEDIQDKIRKSSVFVLSSKNEGLPNVLIEAMALGVPVVSTDCPCGGPATLLEFSDRGILVPVGNADRLAEGMVRLCRERDLAEQMGKNAALYVRENCNSQQIASLWLAYLQQISKKKRIAFYIGSLAKGGAERVIVNLAEYFLQNQYDVTIITKMRSKIEYQTSPQIKRVIADIMEEETSNSRICNLYRRIAKLRKCFKEAEPDCIVSFIGKNNFMAITASRGLHIPVTVSVRSAPQREYPGKVNRLLAGILFRITEGVVFQTRQAQSFFAPSIRKKSMILANPLNYAFIKEPYRGERKKEIVWVGRMDSNKNPLMALEAFEKISKDFRDWKLVYYGDGELYSMVQEEIKKRNLTDYVECKGKVEQVENCIDKSAVLVLTSKMEGMPNVLMEAMALGLAVISTDCPCGGPADLIEKEKNGLLIPVDDVEALALAMAKMMGDREYRLRLGKEAERIVEKLHPDMVNKQWKDYLEKQMK